MADSPTTSNGDPLAAAASEAIRIRGARTHNLRDVNVDIPRDRLVVITGPSGSGKSSLAFDTLYAEGQRQYIESLSVYARQFLHQMERPDVDLIDGLQPTIAVDQRAGAANPRSTVATVTEIYDYLRLLMARVGLPHCHQCGAPIRQQTPEEIHAEVLNYPAGTKAMILAPLVRGRKGQHHEVFETIRKAGFLRARVDGEVIDAGGEIELPPRKNHTIEAVVDRIVVREGVEDRIAESLNLATTHGEGAVVVSFFERESEDSSEGVWRDRLYSTIFACPNCKISYEEIEPRTFSFNSPYGACPTCDGLGWLWQFDPDLVLPDSKRSLSAGAIAPWREMSGGVEPRSRPAIEDFIRGAGLDWSQPLNEWSPGQRRQLLQGDGKAFLGVLVFLEQEYATAVKAADRQRLEAFRGHVLCPDCGGARLRPEARSVRLGDKSIHEVAALDVLRARAFMTALALEGDEAEIAAPLIAEIAKRLDFLHKVGLGYLTLDRSADTLSGGELQRVRLATGIGSGLVGVCYVLDEPSIGLHPRDNQRLIAALRALQQQGNTVVVVEHDEATMRQCDELIDLGPGAGEHGGRIVSQGPPQMVAADANSLTGLYLSGQRSIPVPAARKPVDLSHAITIEGATTNNLQNVSAAFPLSAFICVTGVSGSGKSSLVNETFARAVRRALGGDGPKPGPHTAVQGIELIDKLVEIDQSAIGRTPRSNPATYTGVFDEIRKVFAKTRDARQRGYKSGRFSFNAKGGRCEECQGQGLRKIEMNFLPDLYVTCPVCEGRRFNEQTLQVRYRDKNIAEVLDMRIDEAAAFFENFPMILRLLTSLREVGLGYLTLGQPSTTLSGGEAQRVKLAAELGRVSTGNTLYLLDEPTTGLHFEDIRKLLEVLMRLVELGNTVTVIEHNLDVIKSADWIIDLGPEGGDGGGHLVATGSPEQVAADDRSHTGRYLREVLNRLPDATGAASGR